MARTTRREFLKGAATIGCVAGYCGEALVAATQSSAGGGTKAGALPIKKGLVYDMLPSSLGVAERFKLARDAGFEIVQANTTPDERGAEEIKKAAEGAGIRIDSVMNMDHWKYPLSSEDTAVVAKSMEGMRTSLRNAKLWGSDAVLLVPAVVNPETTYLEAWTRSQKQIRELIPMAAELKVVIAIEEVWNKFLLSPLEMKKYIAEFESSWIKAWFDVGNV
ncbi:MAG: sugar phosphate isomerase/epimerase family protein, partial [Candidatus Acidiferrum sp.]